MSQTLKVNINYDDANTIMEDGMYYNAGMNLEVGTMVESGSITMSTGDSETVVNTSDDLNYNATGCFVLIRNGGTGNGLYYEVSIIAAEAAGSDDTWIKMGRLLEGEFVWINLAGPNDSGSPTPRGIRVRNADSGDVIMQYSIFSR